MLLILENSMKQLKHDEIQWVIGSACNMCPDTKRAECRCGIWQPGYNFGNFLITAGKYAMVGGIISFVATVYHSFGNSWKFRLLYKIIF